MTYLSKAIESPRRSIILISIPFIFVLLILSWIGFYEINAAMEMQHIIKSDFNSLEYQLEKAATDNSYRSLRAEAETHLISKLKARQYIIIAISISTLSLIAAWLLIFSIIRRSKIIKGTEEQLEELLYYNQVTELHNRSSLASRLPVALLEIQKNRAIFASQLEEALDKKQFCLHYQPIVNPTDGQIIGLEALLRWEHPDYGLLTPDAFLFLCENTGLIVPLGNWVLNTACTQLNIWHDMGYRHLELSVNLSARQINFPGLFDSIHTAIKNNNISPHHIKFEITESLVMKDVEANIQLLKSLRSLGVQLALDDFGAGYSSLNYLKQFPFNILKIDKSFISEMMGNITSLAIVEAIISLGKSLGLIIVAEGVENRNQLHMLRTMNCDLVQGYLYSKPLPASEFTLLLTRTTLPSDAR
jgi:EAL domain-containing protein (putative c-di-GMP-specific phosphodiesterase class I)